MKANLFFPFQPLISDVDPLSLFVVDPLSLSPSPFVFEKNFMSLSTLGKERRRPVPSVHQSLRSFSHLIPICSTSSFCPTSQVPTIPRATTSTLSLTQCWPPFVTNFGIRALILDQMASISSTRAVTPSKLAISQTLQGKMFLGCVYQSSLVLPVSLTKSDRRQKSIIRMTLDLLVITPRNSVIDCLHSAHLFMITNIRDDNNSFLKKI